MTETVIDAEVIDEPGTELEQVDHGTTLFRTDDPVQVLAKATETADALASVLKSRKLTSKIQGRDHVNVEGWQTLGSMLGVTPVCVWTRSLDNGWEARVEARTLDGRVVGAAEAMCTRAERTWAKRDDYALRSMAQTRATSKALASPLRFVITLAGYEGTPAEEMPTEAYSLDRLNRVGGDLAPDEKRAVGDWIFNGNDSPDPQRLRTAIDRIENGDSQGLLAHVSVAMGVEIR
jgi:hypothetical protein